MSEPFLVKVSVRKTLSISMDTLVECINQKSPPKQYLNQGEGIVVNTANIEVIQ